MNSLNLILPLLSLMSSGLRSQHDLGHTYSISPGRLGVIPGAHYF